jgi:hypothetical protein
VIVQKSLAEGPRLGFDHRLDRGEDLHMPLLDHGLGGPEDQAEEELNVPGGRC